MNQINKNTEKGFTLIELIIAIAILAIVSVAFLPMFSTAMIGISGAGKKSAAHYTAQNQMESTISDSTTPPTGVFVTDINPTDPNSPKITMNFFDTSGQSTGVFPFKGTKIDVNYIYGNQTKILTSFTTK